MPRRNIPSKQPARKRSTSFTCETKQRYQHQEAAERAATQRMKLEPDVNLRVYMCGQCGGWHLTSKT